MRGNKLLTILKFENLKDFLWIIFFPDAKKAQNISLLFEGRKDISTKKNVKLFKKIKIKVLSSATA